jgi:hypothetical protein
MYDINYMMVSCYDDQLRSMGGVFFFGMDGLGISRGIKRFPIYLGG